MRILIIENISSREIILKTEIKNEINEIVNRETRAWDNKYVCFLI